MKLPNRKVMTFAAALSVCLASASNLAFAQSMFDPTPTVPAGEVVAPAPSMQDAAPPAAAAAKPRRAAPKKRAPREATKVNIINSRTVTLTAIEVTSTASASARPQVVATNLEAGKRKTSNLARRGGCVYNITGSFDDNSTVEVASMDLCKDANINLTE